MTGKTQNTTTEEERAMLALDGNLCLEGIETLKSRLTDCLQDGSGVDIDAGAVVAVDTASLQLLAAFMNKAALLDVPVRWRRCPEVLQTSAEALGLDRHLGLRGIETT